MILGITFNADIVQASLYKQHVTFTHNHAHK